MKKNFQSATVRCKFHFYSFFLTIITIGLTITTHKALAQTHPNLLTANDLKKLSMEELINMEVTSVSKRAEKLTEAASAIQVITGEDIYRSGVTNLPDALKLAANLQVAQLNSYAWITSARGFNAIFSNKLLVMIDGRTVYSPLFAGVFWDVQNVLLEDVDRIEVISGPGGTLWGANAVNGIINIITKNTKSTQGHYISGAAGTFLKNYGALRYGGKIGPNASYRIYGQHHDYNNTFQANGKDNNDKWGLTQGGFRVDFDHSASTLMIQGNTYGGTEQTTPSSSNMDGQNILGQWTRTFSNKSDLTVQAYVDRTWRRDIPSTISDELITYDFDVQHRFPFGKRQSILLGAGYRYMDDKSQHSTLFVGFLPETKGMSRFSSFLQDEITFLKKTKLTIGTKLLHDNYSGFEVQPSARFAWSPTNWNTLWAACSRAVRTPSRIDVDYNIPTYPVPLGTPNVNGGPNFVSEKVIAFELGYRVQPVDKLTLSLALFYNQYRDLYSVEALPGTQTYQIQNGTQGYSNGAELSANYQLLKSWRLRGGYTYFNKKLENKPGHTFDFYSLGNDPKNSFLLQSMTDLPNNFQFNITARYSDKRPNPYTPDYFTFDANLAWRYKQFEISLAGQNLWEDKHIELGSQISRSIYGKLTCRF